ncbi:three component ABC system middle component [Winogradskyella helgolandensis]|uniref:three component ABC system middle component n=1 Tax=Winogradskyella helgolandensis TaxID=2697010 RepID=UPI0015CCF359|nr:three component ABC system middle component [Winogradskyella helgolandensis]
MNPINREFDLYDIMQNTALSALACHSFVLGYYKVAKNKNDKKNYPSLDYLFFILPIVYHKDTRVVFKSSNELYNVILKNKEIILGLQTRANKMSPQTFNALNLAFSKKVLSYNKESKAIELARGFMSTKIKIPSSLGHENIVKNIQDSAFKLGSIFAKNSEKNLQLELNIRF